LADLVSKDSNAVAAYKLGAGFEIQDVHSLHTHSGFQIPVDKPPRYSHLQSVSPETRPYAKKVVEYKQQRALVSLPFLTFDYDSEKQEQLRRLLVVVHSEQSLRRRLCLVFFCGGKTTGGKKGKL
jgi:hypothetical protein